MATIVLGSAAYSVVTTGTHTKEVSQYHKLHSLMGLGM